MFLPPTDFESIIQERLPFLQKIEELLSGRTLVVCTDLSHIETDEITTPKSLQHVGLQIVETAKGDWTTSRSLQYTIVPYLTELIEFWETIFQRHREARLIFTAAVEHPYCLILRSFSTVGHPIEFLGGRIVMYLNDPSLDANLATTLMMEAKWLNPVSCLHTDDLQLLARSGIAMPSFRVSTANWQTILNDAIVSSSSIIFYIEGDTPGVDYEIGLIKEHNLEGQTIIIHRGDITPQCAQSSSYAGVMSIEEFIEPAREKTGAGKLSTGAKRLLRTLAIDGTTRTPASQRLLTLPCEIVNTRLSEDFVQRETGASYFVTGDNAAAFVSYLKNFIESLILWNAVSQDIRLRGIQPTIETFNTLYISLRMAFVSATCLGFTSSIALTLGLLTKVASMAKFDQAENWKRLEQYDLVLDIAERFDMLTEQHGSIEKIRAFRASIHEDLFL